MAFINGGMMPYVHALRSFVHGETRERNSRFFVTDPVARDLARAGLVRILEGDPDEGGPAPADGERSSALPAAQASPQATAKPSKAGGRRRKRAAPSRG